MSYYVRRRCKTHLIYSKNSLEELSSMSSYQELLLKELFVHHENRKKWENIYLQDELLGGSSYFIGLICSEIESLSILNVFCTVSQRPKSIPDHSRLD